MCKLDKKMLPKRTKRIKKEGHKEEIDKIIIALDGEWF